MNSKVVKIVAGITASIISLAVIFYIVNGIDALTELAEYEGEFVSATKSLVIFELVVAVVILLCGVFTAIISFNPSTNKKNTITLLLSAGILIALEKLISIIWTLAIAKKYISPDISISAINIITVIFICLTLLFMSVAILLIRNKKETQSGIIGAGGSLWFVVVIIIAISSGTDSNGFTILYLIFMIVAFIMMIATFGLSAVKESNKAVSTQSIPNNQVGPTYDSAEELLKLKKLLDAGAITQEEYEEKRKKYVDCL